MARHLRRTLSAEAASNAVSALAAWYVVGARRHAARRGRGRLAPGAAGAGAGRGDDALRPPDLRGAPGRAARAGRAARRAARARRDARRDARPPRRRVRRASAGSSPTRATSCARPLAVIRTEAEVALANPEPDVEELREVAEAVSESVVRTEALLDGLMLLARSQPGLLRPRAAGPRRRSRAASARRRHGGAAAATSPSGAGASRAHDRRPGALERLVANLVENGVRHNVPGGWVDVPRAPTGTTRSSRCATAARSSRRRTSRRLTAPFERLGRDGGRARRGPRPLDRPGGRRRARRDARHRAARRTAAWT